MEDKLAALYDLGQRLVLMLDTQQIVETVLDIAVRVLDFQDSDFLLVDPARRVLYVAAKRGQMLDDELELPLDGDSGITVAAARSGRSVYVPNVAEEPRYVSTGFAAASELAAPVQIEGRLFGVLNVESAQSHAFSEADRELLTILANQAALALENARLHVEERHRAEEMLILNELAARINANLELSDTLEAVVSAAAELIPCALAEVSLWNEDTEMLTLHALQCDPERAFPLGCSYPPGEGYTGWLVRQRRPLLVPDVDEREDIRPHLLPGELPYQAYAGVPLLAGEKLVGTLVLVSDDAGAFDSDDMRLLQALAHHATMAIGNARVYERVTRRNRALSALFAVAEAVNCPGDLDEILREGLKQVLSVTGLEMGAIAVADSETAPLVLQCQVGMSPEIEEWLEEQLGRKALAQWPDGETLLVKEVRPDSSEIPLPVREEGVRLTAEVPLFAEGGMVGVLSIATCQPRQFSAEEKSLLQAIGHQLGTAIANERLRQDALMTERLAAVGRVAAGVAHDLRSPLGGILRSAEFLARPELSPDMRHKLSQAVVSLIHRLMNTTQQILDYVHKEKLPLKRAPCSLCGFLDEVLAVLDVDFSDRGIEVVHQCNYGGEVVMDADRMAQVVYNIAANARDAMPRGGTFTVATCQSGEQVELRFSDTGLGVPEEARDRIFEPLFTYGKREGAGLGLSIARRIVEEHGGRLWLESSEGGGAAFVVSLPR